MLSSTLSSALKSGKSGATSRKTCSCRSKPLSLVFSESSQAGAWQHSAFQQFLRALREKHLATPRKRKQAIRPKNDWTTIAAAHWLGDTAVDRHADMERSDFFHVLEALSALYLAGGCHGFERVGKCRAETISAPREHHPRMRLDHFANERFVSLEGYHPGLHIAIEQTRSTLDIGHQESNRSAWKLGHHSTQVTSGAEPAEGPFSPNSPPRDRGPYLRRL
ncbi:MAG TPA: hypothetical protein VGJ60_03375 [Chloroflexota bacterium]|jgi:hypothetical protein